MPTKTAKSESPRMSNEAVKAKTGKDWNGWFALLDKAGAEEMSHQQIAQLLSAKFDVGPWWCQMVTVSYEQARGLRAKHERPEGFQISVSRTVGVSLNALYKSFSDPKLRKRWLGGDDYEVRTAIPNKSIRATWKDKRTSLEINFISKGDSKGQVVVQHSKLPDAKSAARMKTYWASALDRLKETVS